MNAGEILKPVLDFLDRQIHERGDILLIPFALLALFLIAWILKGGLRRRGDWSNTGSIIFFWRQAPPPQPHNRDRYDGTDPI